MQMWKHVIWQMEHVTVHVCYCCLGYYVVHRLHKPHKHRFMLCFTPLQLIMCTPIRILYSYYQQMSVCNPTGLPVNYETGVSLELEQFRTMRTRTTRTTQSSVATRLRLHWCLRCARVLQAERRRSVREGSPGNRTMQDRPGNKREWRWRWEWYSNYEWILQEALLPWGAESALTWLHFLVFFPLCLLVFL